MFFSSTSIQEMMWRRNRRKFKFKCYMLSSSTLPDTIQWTKNITVIFIYNWCPNYLNSPKQCLTFPNRQKRHGINTANSHTDALLTCIMKLTPLLCQSQQNNTMHSWDEGSGLMKLCFLPTSQGYMLYFEPSVVKFWVVSSNCWAESKEIGKWACVAQVCPRT